MNKNMTSSLWVGPGGGGDVDSHGHQQHGLPVIRLIYHDKGLEIFWIDASLP